VSTRHSIHARALVALMLLFTVGACASAAAPEVEPQAAAGPAWPPPPLEARILYTRTLVSEDSLGNESSFGESLFAATSRALASRCSRF